MNIESMFSPTSIAVLGASNRKGSVGNAVMINIISGGFAGKLYPVNPSSETILGLKCYSSILQIAEPVDLAIIITPSKVVPKVLEECGKKGVKAAVIISAGFKEIGEQGKILEEKIKSVAKSYGIRILGPNCIGFINTDPKVSLNASFTKGMPKSGDITLVSQSGAICVAMLEYAKTRNVGFSKVFSTGNKVDLNENDLLTIFANDDATKVILMYIEDLVDGRKFIEIASRITGDSEKRRPILALKVGESAIGAKSIASHTGALAGSQEAYKAIFAQSGVLRVETLEELFDYAIAFAFQPIPKYGSGASYQLVFLTAAILSIVSIVLAIFLKFSASPKCQNRLLEERGGMDTTITQTIVQKILKWPGVTTEPNRFGGIEFLVDKKEMGHLHGERLFDLPFTIKIRENLVASGQALPHHIYPESGWVSYWIRNSEDIPAVINLFKLQYERLKSKSPIEFTS